MALTLPDTSAWLAEDVGGGDVTTLALVDEDATCKAVVLAKEPGVVCGLEVATAVFAELGVGFEPLVADGTEVERGPIADVEGPARGVLTGERLALNLVGRLSGIATLTRRYVDAVEGTGATILDTRKTTPGLRALEKHAVATGGAHEPPLRPRRRRAREGQPSAADRRHRTRGRRHARRHGSTRRGGGGDSGAGA